jgi:SAM-dependent methyltransferase
MQGPGGCDGRYASHRCVWGFECDRVVTMLGRRVPLEGARVLDAGCGEGRNAAFLARHGARVRAVDVSFLAIERARALWSDVRLVDWEIADLTSMPLEPSSFDAVLACSFFHWLDDAEAVAATASRFREAIRPGGACAIVVFNDRVRYSAPAGETRSPCLLPHGWYRDLFADWTLVDEGEEVIEESHVGHPDKHVHAVTHLVATRPPVGP